MIISVRFFVALIALFWATNTMVNRITYADTIVIFYEAQISTIAGTPFGLDNSDLNSVVSGYFQYERSTPDQNPGNTERGDYPHNPALGGIGGGGFEAVFSPNSVSSFTITGSDIPLVNIEDFSSAETFRFRDGPDTFNPGGTMSLNGVSDDNIRMSLAITDGSASTFDNDSLPGNPFPMMMPPNLPHTFSIGEIDSGDVVLLQFTSFQGVPEPGFSIVMLFGTTLILWRRR